MDSFCNAKKFAKTYGSHDPITAPSPIKIVCIEKPSVRWSEGSKSATKRSERFHGHVKGCVHYHQYACPDIQRRKYTYQNVSVWHKHQRDRSKYGATTESKVAFDAKRSPGVIAVMTDDRLYNHTR